MTLWQIRKLKILLLPDDAHDFNRKPKFLFARLAHSSAAITAESVCILRGDFRNLCVFCGNVVVTILWSSERAGLRLLWVCFTVSAISEFNAIVSAVAVVRFFFWCAEPAACDSLALVFGHTDFRELCIEHIWHGRAQHAVIAAPRFQAALFRAVQLLR